MMEADGRRAAGRVEASPERGRPAYAAAARPAPARPMRRVQIIYYLCRNGQLEHPHFMEIAQHPHQPLRLKGTKHYASSSRGGQCNQILVTHVGDVFLPVCSGGREDVMDRLTLLRGKGMPALFSWSCKR